MIPGECDESLGEFSLWGPYEMKPIREDKANNMDKRVGKNGARGRQFYSHI